jgi:quinol monooxygenase YgiN
MATPVLVFATFRPLEGKEQELLAILAPMLKHTRLEPGNEVYDLYRSENEGVAYHLFERYVDADALEAHRASDQDQTYRAAIPEILSAPIGVAVLSEVDVA